MSESRMFRSGGTEKAQPPFLMERLLSKLLNLNFYFMKKEKEKLFRVLPLAVSGRQILGIIL